jgi:membrane-bound lytic murein transglycosylase B
MISKSIIFALLVVASISFSTQVFAQTSPASVSKELEENQRDSQQLELILRQEEAQKIDEQKLADQRSDADYFATKRKAESLKANAATKSEPVITKENTKTGRATRRAYNVWVSSDKKITTPVKAVN